MNTLAKVVRSESAAAFAAFRPDDLSGNSVRATGSSAFQFPVLDSAELHTPVKFAAEHNIFPEIDELPAVPAPQEHDHTAIELALREKAIQEARAAVEAEMNAKTGALRDELTRTIDSVSALANELTVKLESDVVELALEIAKKIVAREVSIEPEVVISVTKKALAKLHSRTSAQIHLNPDDLAYVQEHRTKLNFHGALELLEDASVAPGGCFIHTDNGDIDGRIDSQFDEITEALLGGSAA
jgi:flagellar assembly protein FliH